MNINSLKRGYFDFFCVPRWQNRPLSMLWMTFSACCSWTQMDSFFLMNRDAHSFLPCHHLSREVQPLFTESGSLILWNQLDFTTLFRAQMKDNEARGVKQPLDKIFQVLSAWMSCQRLRRPCLAISDPICSVWKTLLRQSKNLRKAEKPCLPPQTVALFYFTDYLIIRPPSPSKSTPCVVKASMEGMEICCSSNIRFAWD